MATPMSAGRTPKDAAMSGAAVEMIVPSRFSMKKAPATSRASARPATEPFGPSPPLTGASPYCAVPTTARRCRCSWARTSASAGERRTGDARRVVAVLGVHGVLHSSRRRVRPWQSAATAPGRPPPGHPPRDRTVSSPPPANSWGIRGVAGRGPRTGGRLEGPGVSAWCLALALRGAVVRGRRPPAVRTAAVRPSAVPRPGAGPRRDTAGAVSSASPRPRRWRAPRGRRTADASPRGP